MTRRMRVTRGASIQKDLISPRIRKRTLRRSLKKGGVRPLSKTFFVGKQGTCFIQLAKAKSRDLFLNPEQVPPVINVSKYRAARHLLGSALQNERNKNLSKSRSASILAVFRDRQVNYGLRPKQTYLWSGDKMYAIPYESLELNDEEMLFCHKNATDPLLTRRTRFTRVAKSRSQAYKRRIELERAKGFFDSAFKDSVQGHKPRWKRHLKCIKRSKSHVFGDILLNTKPKKRGRKHLIV